MTGPRIYTETIAATAGNVGTTITIPKGGMYKLMYGQIALTTDATVANRRLITHVRNSSGTSLTDIHAGAVVPASSTDFHHSLMQGVYRETSFTGDSLQIPIPDDFWGNADEQFYIEINAGVAGDSYSGYLRFEFQEMPPY